MYRHLVLASKALLSLIHLPKFLLLPPSPHSPCFPTWRAHCPLMPLHDLTRDYALDHARGACPPHPPIGQCSVVLQAPLTAHLLHGAFQRPCPSSRHSWLAQRRRGCRCSACSYLACCSLSILYLIELSDRSVCNKQTDQGWNGVGSGDDLTQGRGPSA